VRENEHGKRPAILRSRSSLSLSLSLSLSYLSGSSFSTSATTSARRSPCDFISLGAAATSPLLPPPPLLFLRHAFRRWKSRGDRAGRARVRTFGGRKTFVLSRSDVSAGTDRPTGGLCLANRTTPAEAIRLGSYSNYLKVLHPAAREGVHAFFIAGQLARSLLPRSSARNPIRHPVAQLDRDNYGECG